MKKSLLVVVLSALAVLLVACGGGNAIVGTWESVYISEGEASFKAIGMVKFDIKADNTLVGNSGGNEAKGSWKQDGDKYTLTVEGSDVEATIEKGLLVVNFIGTSKMHFSKDAANFKDYPEGVIDMNTDMDGDSEKEDDTQKEEEK